VLSLSDRALVRRLLSGDEDAFAEFFDEYFPALYRFALSRLGRDADSAEEVAQATLCRVVTKLHTYRGEAALFTWLCTFCRHEISAFHERAGRRPETVGLVEDGTEVAAALDSLWALAGDGPDERLRRSEIAGRVHVTLDRLPRRYAAALEWKYIDGESVHEIASRLGLSGKAAESLLTRARQAFRDAFRSLGDSPATWRGRILEAR
jgi:RNA polymerase sigma-70 factor (ECF subfamily)